MHFSTSSFFILCCLISIFFTNCNSSTTTKSDSSVQTTTEETVTETTAEPEPETGTNEVTPPDKKYPSVNIKANDKIASPVDIKVNSEGLWFGFEGELGTVTLVDASGKKLGLGILSTTENWMTKDPVNYKTTLSYKAEKSGNGKLIFKGKNPSGDKIRDKSFEIPVTYEKS